MLLSIFLFLVKLVSFSKFIYWNFCLALFLRCFSFLSHHNLCEFFFLRNFEVWGSRVGDGGVGKNQNENVRTEKFLRMNFFAWCGCS